MNRKDKLKLNGKCVNHFRRNAVFGKTMCQDCLDYLKKYYIINKKKQLQSRHKRYINTKQETLKMCKKYYKIHKKDILFKAKINYNNNKLKYSLRAKLHYKKNKKHIKNKVKNYRKTKKGKNIKILAEQRRRAYKNNVIHDFTKEEWINKVKKTKGKCLKKYGGCGKYVGYKKLTLDHFYPLFRAYQDYLKTGIKRVYTINDVNPICRSCNAHKSIGIIIIVR
jgi:hypothetical protein